MHPEKRKRLEARLRDEGYSCGTFWQELPYTMWNTCPLCVCGLMPVFVVCFSAVCRLDYATHVTDIGAEIINEMGLSYTVYYTAGCWPQRGPQALNRPSTHCNSEDFEIAASEFDALTGSLLRVRNVTAVHAKRLTAVKVTPDWRFVTFIGALSQDLGNLYAVDAQREKAPSAVPLLSPQQIQSLDAACSLHTRAVREVLQAVEPDRTFLEQQARLSGFKQLQVVLPGIAPAEFGGTMQGLPAPSADNSVVYRAAFSFTCSQGAGAMPIEFSKLAVLDFQLKRLSTAGSYAASELRVMDTATKAPRGANDLAKQMAQRFQSQSCPRFVPSKQGAELLFVAEDVAPQRRLTGWTSMPMMLPHRVLAQLQMLETPTGRKLRPEAVSDEGWQDAAANPALAQRSAVNAALERHEAEVLLKGAKEVSAISQMLAMGDHEMPFASISGCPEFVPSFYTNTESLQEAFKDEVMQSPEERLRRQRIADQTRDSFVCITVPNSNSVLGVEAQVLAGSLAVGPPMGEVINRMELYNVKRAENSKSLVVGGCKPIRAAGRQGHMRMEAALESVMKTFQFSDDRRQYTTWLACITQDQKVAIVESEKHKNWINMSMPYPFWTENNQFDWCGPDNQESCFEVWSNPNPND